MSRIGAVCEECGYDLAGLIESGASQQCPECGSRFERGSPFVKHPWPFWPWVILRTSGPTAALVALLTIVGATSSAGITVVIYGWPAWFPAWVIASTLVPYVVAEQLTTRCLLRPRRASLRKVFIALGILLNVGVSLGTLRLLIAVL